MFENIFNKFDNQYYGKYAAAIDDNTNVFVNYPGFGAGFVIDKNVIAGVITGMFTSDSKGIYIQIMFPNPVELNNNSYTYGYIEPKHFYLSNNAGFENSENILSDIIEYHQGILENNLLSVRIINILEKSNKPASTTDREQLYTLQSRLMTRNKELEKGGLLIKIEKASSPHFSIYNKNLVDFMNRPRIGVFVVDDVVILVVFALIAIGVGIAGFSIGKKLRSEAKIDFKYSKNLNAILLKKLTPDEYQLLQTENAANANKIANNASGKSTFNTIKYLGFGVLAIWGFDKFNNFIAKK
ncbi:MAG: hypothetical protein Q7U47_01305 [Paludibacter sp.]|nr:hypothetical protein [Paludibacter sp.]